jgi:tRNA G18 (ribose-2'-O)-methylase SpoU
VLSVRRTPLVLLDEPRHPGNAGAVIRVAAAAGASGVATTGTLEPWHPAVIRGSAGLHFALPVLRVTPDDVTGPLLVLDAEGDEQWGVPDDAVLVIGSERRGIGSELRARADAVIRLPMTTGVSSLNLATATAAVLYRWRFTRSMTERRERPAHE